MSPPRPLYVRLLRLRHLNLRASTTFVLFEGSFGLGLLLAFADVVSPWGVVAVPMAVGAMVKLNDVVAGILIRPLALAQLRTPRLTDGGAVGRSPVPRPSYPTTDIGPDDAVADPAATPDGVEGGGSTDGVARGIAAVPTLDPVNGRRPLPGIPAPEPSRPATADAETARPDGADRRSRGNQGRFTS